MVIQYRRNPSLAPDVTRVGFTVTRRQGGAVVRNRIRRRLREALRLEGHRHLRAGYDYVVIGRQAALECSFAHMTDDLRYALRKALAAAPAAE